MVKTTHILKILNGKGGDHPDSWFDPHWLAVGIQIEMEHTTRKDVAKIIAKQHLYQEGRNYYKYLLEMEDRLRLERSLDMYFD
jgi:hypothetical protein